MCGRLHLSTDPDEIAADLGAVAAGRTMEPRWNVPPGAVIPIVVERLEDAAPSGGTRRRLPHLEFASWGLLPRWARDERLAAKTFNARSETVAEKPTFRDAFLTRRCLVPVTGYYEWSRAEGRTQPWRMHAAAGGQLVMAGLYEWWRNPDGSWRLSTTVLTAPAMGHLAAVHHRMPVFLAAEVRAAWLAVPGSRAEALRGLHDIVADVDPDTVARHPVGAAVGDVRNDEPALAEPVAMPI